MIVAGSPRISRRLRGGSLKQREAAIWVAAVCAMGITTSTCTQVARDEEWKEVVVRDMAVVTVPPSMSYRVYGDHRVGLLTDRGIELHFLEGGTPAPDLPLPELEWAHLTIDNRNAFLRVFEQEPAAYAGYALTVRVYVPDVGDGRRSLQVSADCVDQDARTLAERIIRSIRFLNGDARSHRMQRRQPGP